MTQTIKTDALVIGAGPAGLFQVFELGLLGVACQCVEALPHAGGQCAELYPDKPIYDIPALACTRADQLVDSLLDQITPFDTKLHFNQAVTSIHTSADGRLRIETDNGLQFNAGAVVVAAGVGAFSTVKMRQEALNALQGHQLYYNQLPDADLAGSRVFVCGDNEAAVNTALQVSSLADTTTLLHRTRRLQAPEALLQQLEACVASGELQTIKGKITDTEITTGQLGAVKVQESRELIQRHEVDYLIACLGTSPKLVPFSNWGFNEQSNASGSRLTVSAETMQSGLPGIYAIGDVNLYAGKRKLILCGFHEATLAAFAIANAMQPEKPVHLQYTTTSTTLRKRLGVLSN